jgi:hypothetical protein
MAINNNLNLGVTPLPFSQGGTNVNAVPTSRSASNYAAWDANINLSANSLIAGYASTATAAGTTTLLVGSAQQQFFTGSTTETVLMPEVFTLVRGQSFQIFNQSSGVVTVQSSGGNLIKAMASGTVLTLTVISTSGTTAASWSDVYAVAEGSGVVSSGTINELAYYAATGDVVSGLATANNGLLVTDGSGVPSIGNAVLADITVNGVTVGRGASAVSTNTVLGAGALATANTTSNGVFIGAGAGDVLVSGSNQIAIGSGALGTATAPGTGNLAIGRQALGNALVTGNSNIAIGNTSLALVTSGNGNTAIGFSSGSGITTAFNSIFIGRNSNLNGFTGNDCTLIGTGSTLDSTSAIGAICIGSNSKAYADNGTDGPGLSFGSSLFPVGFNTAGTIYTNGANSGYANLYLNDSQYFWPLFDYGVATASAAMVTDSLGSPVLSGSMSDGQLIIGSTGATPTAATLTAGSGIAITNGAGSITVSSTLTGFVWAGVAGTSQAAAVEHGYVIQNAGLTSVTLPATAALGAVVAVQGLGVGGWSLIANAGQVINVGALPTSTAGSVSSANQWDCIEVVCVVANTTWAMRSSVSAGFVVV